MKPVVLRSIEAPGGRRCVDILRDATGSFGHVECRRAPEDGHGWRRLGAPCWGARDEDEALSAARGDIGWLEDIA